MKGTILSAAIEVVASDGLNNWTVEEVASRARCAKGLVNYHYRSKQDLLVRAATTVRDDRSARRLSALQSSGAQALDRLWAALVTEVESGWFAAWLAFIASEGPLRDAATRTPSDSRAFAVALARALDQGSDFAARDPELGAVLDGLQLGLIQGTPPRVMEEAYHRFWLGALG